jgi:hypothetical protein
MFPDRLHFEITGFGRETHEVEWRRGFLWHRQTEEGFSRPIEARLQPDPKQWEAFWRAVEAADVWHWKKEYLSEVCDGTQWSLKLKIADRKVHCEGSNAYPGSDDPDYSRSSAFSEFVRALRVLTGHPIR